MADVIGCQQKSARCDLHFRAGVIRTRVTHSEAQPHQQLTSSDKIWFWLAPLECFAESPPSERLFFRLIPFWNVIS